MAHVLDGIDAGDEHGRGNQQAEEQAQRVDLQGDADGIAAGYAPAAHPVGDYLTVEHDRLYKSYHAGQRHGHGQQREYIAQGLLMAENDGKEGAEEQDHYGVDREVMVVKNAHPLSLLISLVSSVPYCSSSFITRARLIAVTQAPMTMLVRVRAWGMGSTK